MEIELGGYSDDCHTLEIKNRGDYMNPGEAYRPFEVEIDMGNNIVRATMVYDGRWVCKIDAPFDAKVSFANKVPNAA